MILEMTYKEVWKGKRENCPVSDRDKFQSDGIVERGKDTNYGMAGPQKKDYTGIIKRKQKSSNLEHMWSLPPWLQRNGLSSQSGQWNPVTEVESHTVEHILNLLAFILSGGLA